MAVPFMEPTMNQGQSVFSQILNHLPTRRFATCVHRHNGDAYAKQLTCLDQFKIMALGQLTRCDSLRDIVSCLRSVQPRLYHLGIGHCVSRSTLADANERRPWLIYADLASVLIEQATELYQHEYLGEELVNLRLYALDSSMIDLCLRQFPWAPYQRTKGAIKLHTLLNLRGNIPTFIDVTHGKVNDVRGLDVVPIQPGAYYIMDRGYLDFARLYRLKQSLGFFITRAKKNLKFARRYSHPVDKSTGLRCDQTIVLTGTNTSEYYPEPLRRVKFRDPETGKMLVFLTNDFELSALVIAQLYKMRWQVELFFKWIKQHLRIKRFFGRSDNAVRTQIWIAIATYLLVAILRKRLSIEASLYEILQFCSRSIFEKALINSYFWPIEPNTPNCPMDNQLPLFTL